MSLNFDREKNNEKMIQCVSFERLFLLTFIQQHNQNLKNYPNIHARKINPLIA
jgi:hypothetical protein